MANDRLRVIQLVPVSFVRLLLDADLPARLCKRAVDAGGRSVDNDDAWPVPAYQAVQHALRKLRGVPGTIPRHDDTHVHHDNRNTLPVTESDPRMLAKTYFREDAEAMRDVIRRITDK